ncbi:MAG TPA: DegV family protein [Acidimicrobiales bacterium]|nr:DegV family protein [Acidimicrobiales bacterium]
MGRVRVITDSSACVPAELVAKFAVCVLPISVFLPEDSLTGIDPTDGGEMPLPEALAREELAGANHPFVTEYLQAIESPDFDAAVVITPAVEFATMYRNAALAAEFALRPVVLVDARTAAAGQALVVLAGAEAAAAGAEIQQVVRIVEQASSRVELVASLATLEPIRRSGPLPDDVLGDLEPSGVRNVFRMRDGTVEPLGTAPTPEEMLEAIHAAYLSSAPRGSERSAVFHANAPHLAARLGELLGGVDFVSGFSVAMQVHTGSGVVGAAWIPVGAAP